MLGSLRLCFTTTIFLAFSFYFCFCRSGLVDIQNPNRRKYATFGYLCELNLLPIFFITFSAVAEMVNDVSTMHTVPGATDSSLAWVVDITCHGLVFFFFRLIYVRLSFCVRLLFFSFSFIHSFRPSGLGLYVRLTK